MFNDELMRKQSIAFLEKLNAKLRPDLVQKVAELARQARAKRKPEPSLKDQTLPSPATQRPETYRLRIPLPATKGR